MKKKIVAMMLAGIMQVNYAHAQQLTGIDAGDEQKYQRIFWVALKKKEKMQVQVTSIKDLAYLENLDSMLLVFFQDMTKLYDSLGSNDLSRRVEYTIDRDNLKRIKITRSADQGSHFAIVDKATVILKIKQDTVIISGAVPEKAGITGTGKLKHYFSICFFLNDFYDLKGYATGLLQDEIKSICQHYTERWDYLEDGRLRLRNNTEISSVNVQGKLMDPSTPKITIAVGIQNYRKYFVPSFVTGISYSTNSYFVKRTYTLATEWQFNFDNDQTGKPGNKTNLFLFAGYETSPANQTFKALAKMYPSLSLAYLVKRNSPVYDKNTFRLSFGRASFRKDKTRLEPAVYFNNFFRKISPSLRLIQQF